MRCSRARSIDKRVEQRRQPRQANAVAVFRQVKHSSSPIAEKVCRQIFRIRSPRPDCSSSRIDGLALTSMTRIASALAADIREQVDGGDAEARARATALPRQRRAPRFGARRFKHHRAAGAQIHPPGNLPALALGQHDVERGVAGRRQPAKGRGTRNAALCAVSRSRIVRTPSPINERRMFSRGIDHLVVEQKNPVFVAGDDRLDQYRVVVARHVVEISRQRGLVMNGLREIAARSRSAA